jgi:hypothetical protein
MYLTKGARKALNQVHRKIVDGDVGPIIEIAYIKAQPGSEIPCRKWSMGNLITCHILRPSKAIDWRGYKQWQKAGRQVVAGAKAAYILVPLTRKGERERQDGRTEQYTYIYGFKSVPVYRREDTTGEPVVEPDYTPQELPKLASLAEELGITVEWSAPAQSGAYGSCTVDGTAIRMHTKESAVLYHEIAHAIHARVVKGQNLLGGQHADQETVAELTAAVLSMLYDGKDYTGNAARYIATYNGDIAAATSKALSDVAKIVEYVVSWANSIEKGKAS